MIFQHTGWNDCSLDKNLLAFFYMACCNSSMGIMTGDRTLCCVTSRMVHSSHLQGWQLDSPMGVSDSLATRWWVSETRSDRHAFKQRTSQPDSSISPSPQSPSETKSICKTRSWNWACEAREESQIYRRLALLKVKSSHQDFRDGMSHCPTSFPPQATTITAKKYCVPPTCRNLGIWHSFIQRWNVALSELVSSASYNGPITAKKYRVRIACGNHVGGTLPPGICRNFSNLLGICPRKSVMARTAMDHHGATFRKGFMPTIRASEFVTRGWEYLTIADLKLNGMKLVAK